RLLDEGSFREIGSISSVARYADDGSLAHFTPANFLFGRGRIDGTIWPMTKRARSRWLGASSRICRRRWTAFPTA
ncbi:MAG: hypothetical protein ABIT38_07820, partial [Gemmatimonadaceae bacterium]